MASKKFRKSGMMKRQSFFPTSLIMKATGFAFTKRRLENMLVLKLKYANTYFPGLALFLDE